MDPFAIVLLGGLGVLLGVVLLLGKYFPGSGLEQIGLKSARQITETREQLEAEDLDQMLVAHNKRRQARGQAEVTASDIEARVRRDFAEQRRRHEEYLSNRDLDQLLEATNARRRQRGLPERTREQAREEFGGQSGPEESGGRSGPDESGGQSGPQESGGQSGRET